MSTEARAGKVPEFSKIKGLEMLDGVESNPGIYPEPKRYSRREILQLGGSLALLGGFGAVLGKEAYARSFSPLDSANLPTQTESVTPEPTAELSINLAPKDADWTLRIASDVHISEFQKEYLRDTREKLEVFKPARDIVVKKSSTLWREDEETGELVISDDFVKLSTEQKNIEVPFALFHSSITRVLREANDANKLYAYAGFVDFYNDTIADQITNPKSKDGVLLFNPERMLPSEEPTDIEKYDQFLETPTGLFASVATSFYGNMSTIVDTIMNMRMLYAQGPYINEGESAVSFIADKTCPRYIAENSATKTRNVLRALATSPGSADGQATTDNIVGGAMNQPDNFGSFFFTLDLQHEVNIASQ